MSRLLETFFDWKDVRNISRSTVDKGSIESEVSDSFKKKLMISEHSPIRELRVRFIFQSIKSWVATHFSRHSWESYITTQRSDRTKVDRDKLSQSTLINLHGSLNGQHLIDTSRKRLCFQSAKDTRELMEELKSDIEKVDPIIAKVMVPNCIYRMGCPEFKACSLYSNFLKYVDKQGHNLFDLTDIDYRYELYKSFKESTQL